MQSIFDRVESRPERYELNLYISGEDEAEADVERAGVPVAAVVVAEPAGRGPTASSPPEADAGDRRGREHAARRPIPPARGDDGGEDAEKGSEG